MIDVEATVHSQLESSLSATSPGFSKERLTDMAKSLDLHFKGSSQVVLRRGDQTVTREYTVLREDGPVRALSVKIGPHQNRRVTLIHKNENMVVLDNHRRIILRRP